MKLQHHVFTTTGKSGGLMRELCNSVVLQDPVSGKHARLNRAIWDTGATGTTINQKIAQQMGLIPTGKVQVHTAAAQIQFSIQFLSARVHFCAKCVSQTS